MLSKRWEHGSEFHAQFVRTLETYKNPWDFSCRFFGSGRDAFRALLLHGKISQGWRRLWIPSYFCPELIDALASTGLRIEAYTQSPENPILFAPHRPIQSGDVLLQVNLFGLHSKPYGEAIKRDGIFVIEDHTHDPWSGWANDSSADWCVASLRKTLPLPEGAVVWSPKCHDLPQEYPIQSAHEAAALQKFAAALIKLLYLKGYPIEKTVFRNLAILGESHISGAEISGMSEWARNLMTFPIASWRRMRKRNHRILSEKLMGLPWLRVVNSQRGKNICPFSVILLFDSQKRRDLMRRELISLNIYPSVLWLLEHSVKYKFPKDNIDFSRRMLSLHCDMRYKKHDMERVANTIIRIGESLA